MSRSTERVSGRPAAELPGPPPGSTDSEVDVIVTTRNDGPGLSDLVKRLPLREIHDLFIVDGGSTDVVTLGILDELETGGYHVIRQDHHGLSRARNAATRVSQAPFLLYLDVGTVPKEGFLADASTRLNDDSTVAAVLADGQWEGWRAIAASEPDPRSMVGALRFEPFAVLRQAAIEKVGGWDERLETGQDRDLFLSLTESDWSFAKLPTIGFTRIADAEKPVPLSDPSSARADGIRIAEKHRELYSAHLTTIIGAYEAALAEAGRGSRPALVLPGVNAPCTTSWTSWRRYEPNWPDRRRTASGPEPWSPISRQPGWRAGAGPKVPRRCSRSGSRHSTERSLLFTPRRPCDSSGFPDGPTRWPAPGSAEIRPPDTRRLSVQLPMGRMGRI